MSSFIRWQITYQGTRSLLGLKAIHELMFLRMHVRYAIQFQAVSVVHLDTGLLKVQPKETEASFVNELLMKLRHFDLKILKMLNFSFWRFFDRRYFSNQFDVASLVALRMSVPRNPTVNIKKYVWWLFAYDVLGKHFGRGQLTIL